MGKCLVCGEKAATILDGGRCLRFFIDPENLK